MNFFKVWFQSGEGTAGRFEIIETALSFEAFDRAVGANLKIGANRLSTYRDPADENRFIIARRARTAFFGNVVDRFEEATELYIETEAAA